MLRGRIQFSIMSNSRFYTVLFVVLSSSSFILLMDLSLSTDDSYCNNTIIRKHVTKIVGSGEDIIDCPETVVNDKSINSSLLSQSDSPLKLENDYTKMAVSETLMDHGTISIDGNIDFQNQASTEGWQGNGTENNPYLIENYYLTDSTNHLIQIRNTNVFFKIKKNTLDGINWNYMGISFSNVTHGAISDNIINNNMQGISLVSNSNNNLITGNSINFHNEGIVLSSSTTNVISNNTFYHNIQGIYLWNSSNNILSGNSVNNNEYGIWLLISSTNVLSGNNASYNNGHGIWLDYESRNNTVHRNIATFNNGYGFYLIMSSNKNNIYYNDIYGNSEIQAYEENDCLDNKWDNGKTGNYWGADYTINYPSTTNDGKIWSTPYEINGTGSGIDHFPLVNSIMTDIDKPQLTIIPEDFSVDFGYTNLNISWIAIDMFPATYFVELNGIEVVSAETWTNGSDISFDIPDSMLAGSHNVTIVVADEIGHTTQDTVIFTVIRNEMTNTSTTSTTRSISIPALTSGFELLPLLLGLLAIMRRRKNQ